MKPANDQKEAAKVENGQDMSPSEETAKPKQRKYTVRTRGRADNPVNKQEKSE